MDRTEAFLLARHQRFVRKELNNCDTCQRTKRPNKKCGKLPAKLYEEIPWNKLCVDLIGPYVIRLKDKK